jgi:CrcB protein
MESTVRAAHLLHELPTDSDVDLHDPRQRAELHKPWAVLPAISIGGAIGALVRYGLTLAVPPAAGAFPWATFGINVLGCLFIGVLMVLVTEVWPKHRLIRPFLGAGALGGFTTFSTYVVDIQRLTDQRAPVVALAYLLGTVITALVAVYAGITVTERLVKAES